MSLKFRLNLMITALLALVMLLGVALLVANARQQVLAEVESTAALATHLLGAETIYYAGVVAGETYHMPYRMQELQHLRHLRIEFYDVDGRLLDTNRPKTLHLSNMAPVWFSRLMTVALPKQIESRRSLVVNARIVGELAIIPDPSYEVAEIWNDTVDLFLLCMTFFVAVNALVYWAVERALRPVDSIWHALEELERGNLDARLPLFHLPELDRISEKFNGMAQTLQHSLARNSNLSRQLINLQEAERKSLARDLHDEMGQYLTAINVDAGAILAITRDKLPSASESAQAIMEVSRQVMDLIGAMLQRLRPDALDEIGLKAALEDLVMTWRQRNRNVRCSTRISEELQHLGDATKITIYRVVQECLTNVSRHSRATRVEIDISYHADERCVEVVVFDDGAGFDVARVDGFGINGMRERVLGLQGTFLLESAPTRGTRVTAKFPFDEGLE